jgi:HlyD family secretion protein
LKKACRASGRNVRKTLVAVGALVVVAGSAYGYYRYTKKDPAPTITYAKITRGDIAETVGATGTVQAVTTVQVGTQVSGTILELNADFNSLVRKGQVLARLDPSLFQTQIEQARANLIRAQADLERLRVNLEDMRTKLRRAQELSEKKLIAQTELEAAEVNVHAAEAQLRSQEAAVTQAQASLKQNEVNQQHTVIEAPIDGLVIARNVDVGQTVAASMSAPTLFLLAADLTKMQVIASLDESDVGRIRPQQLAHFKVDAYPNEDFIGTVTQVRLQPQTVQNVVTYSTVIDVPNPELKLKPGMTANVNIEIARRNNVLRVPNAALRFRPTNEMFTALGQTPPPAPTGFGGRGRRGGAGTPGEINGVPDTKNAQPATPTAPPAKTTAAASGSPTVTQVAQATTAAQATAESSGQRRVSGGGRGTGAGGDNAGAEAANAGTASGGREGVPVGGFGGGRGGGRGGDFQARMRERMANMSPEEREQMIARMRARGFTPPTDTQSDSGRVQPAQAQQAGSPAQGSQRSARQNQRNQSQSTPAPARAGGAGATTIDALFGPLPPTESFGQVWLHANGKLSRARLRLGIADGQQTEIVQVLDNTNITEGTEVVTAITTAAQRNTATGGANAFPGLGGQRGGFPGGGFQGGGNRGAGGTPRGGR